MMSRIPQLWTERKARIIVVVLVASGVLFGAVRCIIEGKVAIASR